MNCPKCGTPCERDEVDVGVGSLPAGPWGCPECYWVEPRTDAEVEADKLLTEGSVEIAPLPVKRVVTGPKSPVALLAAAMAMGSTVREAIELRVQNTNVSGPPDVLAAIGMGLATKKQRSEAPWNTPKQVGWLRPKEIPIEGPTLQNGKPRYSAIQAADGRAYTRDNADGVVRNLIKQPKGKAARRAEKAARRAARRAEDQRRHGSQEVSE